MTCTLFITEHKPHGGFGENSAVVNLGVAEELGIVVDVSILQYVLIKTKSIPSRQAVAQITIDKAGGVSDGAIAIEQILSNSLQVKTDGSDQVTVTKVDVEQYPEALKLEFDLPDASTRSWTRKDVEFLENWTKNCTMVFWAGNHYWLHTDNSTIRARLKRTEPDNELCIRGSNTTIVFEGIPEKLSGGDVSLDDVGGLDEIITQFREIVQLPIELPSVFQEIGVSTPNGVLLHGPPGCGKTMLARALANDMKVNFESITGPELTSKYVGEGEKKLREVWDRAAKKAPSIIFIDEIDSIAGIRDEASGQEHVIRMVGQLLGLMDGIEQRHDVIVIGATNKPSAIDPTFRRPGRFDREIEINMPDKAARQDILSKYLQRSSLGDDVNVKDLASRTVGYSGADLANLWKEAGLACIRRSTEYDAKSNSYHEKFSSELTIHMQDFEDAFKWVNPSTMRDMDVSVPERQLSDVVGRDIQISELKQQLEWRFSKKEQAFQLETGGVLLTGRSGAGKTMLIEAMGCEYKASLINVDCGILSAQILREAQRTLGRVFTKAKQLAPSILVFDRIDSLFGGSTPTRTMTFINILTSESRGLQYFDVFLVATASKKDEELPDRLNDSIFPNHIELDELEGSNGVSLFRREIETRCSVELTDDFIELTAQGMNGGEIVSLINRILRVMHNRGTECLDEALMKELPKGFNR